MESPLLGLIVDSSIWITAERRRVPVPEVLAGMHALFGDVRVEICALTVAELGHGIYSTDTVAKAFLRRTFLDELKAHVAVRPITTSTAEIVARLGGQQAARGITIPFADLIIGACAIELGYAVATHNVRHFRLIPGLDVQEA